MLVFHNVAFDLPFLRAMLRQAGAPRCAIRSSIPSGLARGLNGPGGNSLGRSRPRLGTAARDAAPGARDARTTARLLVALSERWEAERGVRSPASLRRRQPGHAAPESGTPMTIGRPDR